MPDFLIEDSDNEEIMRMYQQKLLVMKCLLNSLPFLQVWKDVVDKLNLFKPHPVLQLIWDMESAYYSKFATLPTRTDLQYMSNESHEDEERAAVTACLPEAFDVSGGIPDKFAADFLLKFKNLQIAKDLQAQVSRQVEEGNLDGLSNMLHDAKVDADHDPSASAEENNPFDGSPDQFMEDTVRVPLGIDFIDHALNGGAIPGEMYAFVMPSGSGKTTFVWQFASEKVLAHQHAVIFSFEQPIKGDLALRSYVLASQSKRSDWAGGDYSKVPVEVKLRYDRARPLWKEYLHAYDTWVDPRKKLVSVSQLFEVIDRLIVKKQEPSVIFIDWWGMMKNKLIESLRGNIGDTERRLKQAQWLGDLRGYAATYRIPVVVFHQMSGAAATKARPASGHDSQEDKAFPNLFDFVFTSNRKSLDNELILRLDKARATRNVEFSITLDGERCKFFAKKAEYDGSLISDIPIEQQLEDVQKELSDAYGATS